MNRLFVANWKMTMPFEAALNFGNQYFLELDHLAQHYNNQLVICPSFVSLAPLKLLIDKCSSLSLGAQNCSAYQFGAYTGEVAAQSLAQLSCTHTLVGHSERRHYFYESLGDVTRKIKQLIRVGIAPIVCIGETKEQYEKNETEAVLTEQLAPVITTIIDGIKREDFLVNSLIIAYEPVWAIGTGKTPTPDLLAARFAWLKEYVQSTNNTVACSFLYGGSVNSDNAEELLAIDGVTGLLIGGASIDFQKLKKIVSLK